MSSKTHAAKAASSGTSSVRWMMRERQGDYETGGTCYLRKGFI